MRRAVEPVAMEAEELFGFVLQALLMQWMLPFLEVRQDTAII